MNSCENQCAGCPFVASLERKIEVLQQHRGVLLDGLCEFMELEADSQDMLQELAQTTGQSAKEIIDNLWAEEGLSAKQLAAKKTAYLDEINLHLTDLDAEEQNDIGLIDMLPALCVNGVKRQLEIAPDGTLTAQEICSIAEAVEYPEAMFRRSTQI